MPIKLSVILVTYYNVGSMYKSSSSALFRHLVNLNATAVIARDVRALSETVVLPKGEKKSKSLKGKGIQV